MSKFENIQNTDAEDMSIEQSLPPQESLEMESELDPDTISETLEIQTEEAQKAMHTVNEAAPDISDLLTEVDSGEIKSAAQEQFGGIMSELGQKFRDSKLAKAAIVALGLMGPTSAFAGDVVNLKENYFKNMPTVSAKNPDNIKQQFNHDSPLASVIKAVKSAKEFVPQQGVAAYGKLSPTLQERLTDPYNTTPQQKKILPGATVNGASVYEIAPGVYGNEHSQYGDGVSIGTIKITN